MKKILLTFVGEQDPYSETTNEEGSIVTLVREIKPDVLFMFPTAKGINSKSNTEINSRETEVWLSNDYPKLNYISRPLSTDPTDYTSLLNIMKSEIKEALSQINNEYKEYELHANCSSGTPQMKTVWLILANSGLLPRVRLWQVFNPKFKPNERVKEIKGDFIEEENIISRSKSYADKLMFSSVIEELKNLSTISIYHQRRQKAEVLKKVFEGYAKWDLIQYKEAYDKLSSVFSNIKGTLDMEVLEKLLEKQINVLTELKNNKEIENDYNIADLIFNSKRRFHNHQYTEVLARFWRVYEGMLYKKLIEKYNINPRSLKQSNKESLKELEKFDIEISKRRNLDLSKADRILDELFNDKEFAKLKNEIIEVDRGVSIQKSKVKDVMLELRGARNDSIVAHGMRPVNYYDALKAILVMEKILDLFFKKHKILSVNEFPLNEVISKKVLECLDL